MHWKETMLNVNDETWMSEVLSDWTYPPGIARLIGQAEPYDLKGLERGQVFLLTGTPEKIEETSVKILRTLVPHMDQGALCSQASRLLHSIKKNVWNDDHEMRMLDVIEHLDIFGIYQIDGLTKEETFDLDRWVAIRGAMPEKYTLLFGDAAKRLKLTTNAYEGRVLLP